MAASNLVLIPGGGGVGRAVFEHLRARDVPVGFMVRREDERAAELNRRGAEVVIGDLTRPETVAAALQGVARMFFAMAVSPDHLLAATVVASVAKEYGKLEALVDLSQMTVSQMTATSTEESHQQRLHWLAEQVLNWSGLPVVHIRPTVFLDTPLFTTDGGAVDSGKRHDRAVVRHGTHLARRRGRRRPGRRHRAPRPSSAHRARL